MEGTPQEGAVGTPAAEEVVTATGAEASAETNVTLGEGETAPAVEAAAEVTDEVPAEGGAENAE